jgi:hypothetical protein
VPLAELLGARVQRGEFGGEFVHLGLSLEQVHDHESTEREAIC